MPQAVETAYKSYRKSCPNRTVAPMTIHCIRGCPKLVYSQLAKWLFRKFACHRQQPNTQKTYLCKLTLVVCGIPWFGISIQLLFFVFVCILLGIYDNSYCGIWYAWFIQRLPNRIQNTKPEHEGILFSVCGLVCFDHESYKLRLFMPKDAATEMQSI